LLRLAFEVRQRVLSNPCLKWSAKLLKLVLDLERRVTQTRVGSETRGFSNPRLKWSAKLLSPALNVGLLMPASKVFILLWMLGPRFSLKFDLCVEVRFVFDDLSLVIFGQLTEHPPKFSILRG